MPKIRLWANNILDPKIVSVVFLQKILKTCKKNIKNKNHIFEILKNIVLKL